MMLRFLDPFLSLSLHLLFDAAFVLGTPLAAKPAKIVAGLEPEFTNVFLQGIASAVKNKVRTGYPLLLFVHSFHGARGGFVFDR